MDKKGISLLKIASNVGLVGVTGAAAVAVLTAALNPGTIEGRVTSICLKQFEDITGFPTYKITVEGQNRRYLGDSQDLAARTIEYSGNPPQVGHTISFRSMEGFPFFGYGPLVANDVGGIDPAKRYALGRPSCDDPVPKR